MDVLQEITRSNGRSVNLLQHQRTSAGVERGKYYVRGTNSEPAEVVTVFLTDEELDMLIEVRRQGSAKLRRSSSIDWALRGLFQTAGRLKR